jgi:hypothetical protein
MSLNGGGSTGPSPQQQEQPSSSGVASSLNAGTRPQMDLSANLMGCVGGGSVIPAETAFVSPLPLFPPAEQATSSTADTAGFEAGMDVNFLADLSGSAGAAPPAAAVNNVSLRSRPQVCRFISRVSVTEPCIQLFS